MDYVSLVFPSFYMDVQSAGKPADVRRAAGASHVTTISPLRQPCASPRWWCRRDRRRRGCRWAADVHLGAGVGHFCLHDGVCAVVSVRVGHAWPPHG